MHAGLESAGYDWMHDNLRDRANTLVAFAADLGTALNGVTLLTISAAASQVARFSGTGRRRRMQR